MEGRLQADWGLRSPLRCGDKMGCCLPGPERLVCRLQMECGRAHVVLFLERKAAAGLGVGQAPMMEAAPHSHFSQMLHPALICDTCLSSLCLLPVPLPL